MKIIKSFEGVSDSNVIWGLSDDGRLYYKLKNSDHWYYKNNDHWYYMSLPFDFHEMKKMIDNFYHLLPFIEK